MATGYGLGWRLPSCHGPHIWEAQGPAPLRPHLASFFLQACWAALAFTSQDPVSCFENFSLLLPGRSFGGAGRTSQVGQAEG